MTFAYNLHVGMEWEWGEDRSADRKEGSEEYSPVLVVFRSDFLTVTKYPRKYVVLACS